MDTRGKHQDMHGRTAAMPYIPWGGINPPDTGNMKLQAKTKKNISIKDLYKL